MKSVELVGLLKEARVNLGMTQAELSRESGVSLPSIQNMEAGLANPSLSTLEPLLGALALGLTLTRTPADWDALAACGAPLFASGPGPRRGPVGAAPRASRELLLRSLREACLDLSGPNPADEDRERKVEAVQAVLMALEAHFPSLFARQIRAPVFERFSSPKEPSGRLIKLKRLATARLASYL